MSLSSPGSPLLELRDATVIREGRTILDVEHLTLARGEHVAILGPNGSGKSTLIGVLTRDVHATAREGEPPVRLLGARRFDLFEARRLFGVVSSALQSTYARRVTVRDTVLSGFFGSVGVHRNNAVTARQRARAATVLSELEIEPLAARTMDTLSTGEARRALIARALVHDPAVLVLDEPYAGLDPTARWHFSRTVSTLTGAGRALVLVTHHIEDIPAEVGRVVMLRGGRVFADGPKTELLADEPLSALFGIPARVECRGGVYRMW